MILIACLSVDDNFDLSFQKPDRLIFYQKKRQFNLDEKADSGTF